MIYHRRGADSGRYNRIFTNSGKNARLTPSENPMKKLSTNRLGLLALVALAFAAPAAKADSGQDVFADNCAVCHSPDAGTNKLGPSLFGIVGRKAGSVSDYTYAPAMKSSGLTWDAATLDKYITDPQGVVKG